MILFGVTNVKRKAMLALRILVFLLILGLAVPTFFGLVSTYISSAGMKYREEHPTGQPLRVEETNQKAGEKDSGEKIGERDGSAAEKRDTGEK
jgi:cell division septal protein FtsQ